MKRRNEEKKSSSETIPNPGNAPSRKFERRRAQPKPTATDRPRVGSTATWSVWRPEGAQDEFSRWNEKS